ncbi:hypothetical protein SAMN05443667_10322 [Flavobacterium gillisiae]|uniref:Uncharacterized protein n=1 Tax=Flavobacterium gillisiae TaxID=150146 RepID=A0A1H3ZQC1_9FLAO|nr:hypothetical protein SAMN05443667_10322 [Flavobacterium gillisiae]
MIKTHLITIKEEIYLDSYLKKLHQEINTIIKAFSLNILVAAPYGSQL